MEHWHRVPWEVQEPESLGMLKFRQRLFCHSGKDRNSEMSQVLFFWLFFFSESGEASVHLTSNPFSWLRTDSVSGIGTEF